MGQPLRVLDEPEKSLAPALFSDTFDASPEGLALDSPCRILHANPAFAGLFGYSNPAEQEAGGKLREQEYSAVIIDQFLLEAEPDGSEQMLQHLDTAIPVYVNFAISGIERVVREIRTALSRRQREEQVARQSAEQAMWSELKESVTALLLSCDLALSVPGVPAPAADKLRAMHDLACQIRERPGYRVRLVSGSWLAHICG